MAATLPAVGAERPRAGLVSARNTHEHAAAERAVYRPRNPTATPLYPIVQQNLETFLARAAEADPLGDGVPHWVEHDPLHR